MKSVKIILVGERLRHRSFSGANKALPVLASSLHNAGYCNVTQMDLERSDIKLDDICKETKNADLIAFAGVMTPQLPEFDATSKAITDHLAMVGRKVPIIAGGYATKGIEDVAREMPWIAGFFNGEGESAIVEIARTIERGIFEQDMPKIQGMCYFDKEGRFHSSTAQRIRNLDEVNQHFGFGHIPEKHDMDIFAIEGRQPKTAQLFTQRGCPWVCEYCNKSTEGNGVVRLSTESFRRQLKELRARGFEAVYLDVDTFTINEKAAREEARLLREEGFVWGSNTRIDMIDRNQMEYFVKNGCIYMFFGVEHILPEVLLAIRKFNGPLQSQLRQANEYVHKVKAVFENMHSVGLPSSYFVILGLPKARFSKDGNLLIGFEPTTFEDDRKVIEFGLNECNPDYLNFNVLRFMPGSLAADKPSSRAFSCVRPSGEKPVTAGYFLPRVAEKLGYKIQENHGVYRLCESVGMNQPTSTAIDAQRIYDTMKYAMEIINRRIERGMKATRLFIDHEVLRLGLVKTGEDGRYSLAPLKEFETLGN